MKKVGVTNPGFWKSEVFSFVLWNTCDYLNKKPPQYLERIRCLNCDLLTAASTILQELHGYDTGLDRAFDQYSD
eukprot:11051985-Karenia_brevis.AAC.1